MKKMNRTNEDNPKKCGQIKPKKLSNPQAQSFSSAMGTLQRVKNINAYPSTT